MGNSVAAETTDVVAPRPVSAFGHQPALDGLRTVAVLLVLLFHAGFSWMPGGYVGVSVFFTLSGFLITSLLLTEWEHTGRIDLGRFFSRRLRRLVPASMVCLSGVAVVRLWGGFGNVANLRSDLLGAVTHTFNWVRIGSDSSYADAFEVDASLASPLEHYWSLAIEEQFYLVFPFALLAILRSARRSGGRSGASVIRSLLIGYLVATTISPIISMWAGSDVAYWSSITRLGELLAGAALGALLLGRRLPSRVGRLATPSLVFIVAAAVVFPSQSGPAYSGWMGVFALASVGLITGLHGDSLVRRVLSTAPMVALGKISYGIYLFHWPVFVWMRQRGWNLASLGGFTVACLVVLVMAVLSARLVERRFRSPKRKSVGATPTRTITAALVSMAAAMLVVTALPFSRGFLEADQASLSAASGASAVDRSELIVAEPRDRRSIPHTTDASAAASESTLSTTAPATSTTVTASATPVDVADPETAEPDRAEPDTAEPDMAEPDIAERYDVDVALAEPGSRPVRVVVTGDSTAFYVGQAFAQWTVGHAEHTTVDLATCDGCGFMLDGTVTSFDSTSYAERSAELVEQRLPETVAAVQPDVVVVMSTMTDMANRRWDDDEGELGPLDAAFRERLATSYASFASGLFERGVTQVIWIKPPVPIWPGEADELREVERWGVMSEVIDEVAAAHSGAVVSLDADEWMHRAEHGSDVDFRPDGVHLTEQSAYELVDRWLAPSVLDVVFAAAR